MFKHSYEKYVGKLAPSFFIEEQIEEAKTRKHSLKKSILNQKQKSLKSRI